MPKAGDTFTIQLKKSHLEWGTHRIKHTRIRSMVKATYLYQSPGQEP